MLIHTFIMFFVIIMWYEGQSGISINIINKKKKVKGERVACAASKLPRRV